MAHQCAYEDEGIRCENEARRKYCEIHKGMSNALKQRAYRERKAQEQQQIGELAAVSDTPLARNLGYQAQGEDVTTRFVPRKDDAPLIDYTGSFQGIAGQSERVPTPYGAEARRAARDAEQNREVVDYGQAPQDYSRLDRTIRDRILSSLPNSVRRDAVKREAHIAHMMRASSLADTPQYNATATWDEITAYEESAAEVSEPETEPYEHAVYFKAPWRTQNPGMSMRDRIQQRMAERNDNVSVDAPEGFRR